MVIDKDSYSYTKTFIFNGEHVLSMHMSRFDRKVAQMGIAYEKTYLDDHGMSIDIYTNDKEKYEMICIVYKELMRDSNTPYHNGSYEQLIMGFMMINFPEWHNNNASLPTEEYVQKALGVLGYIRQTLDSIL